MSAGGSSIACESGGTAMISYLVTLGVGVLVAIAILVSLGPVHNENWFDDPYGDDGVW